MLIDILLYAYVLATLYIIVMLWILTCLIIIPGSFKEAWDTAWKWPFHACRGIVTLFI